MQYTVRTSQGSAITVVTDQTQVRIGDCVSVEETGDTANIRRVDDALCQPVSPQVVEQASPMMQAEADRCEQAKERLFAATTPEEVEVARQVITSLPGRRSIIQALPGPGQTPATTTLPTKPGELE